MSSEEDHPQQDQLEWIAALPADIRQFCERISELPDFARRLNGFAHILLERHLAKLPPIEALAFRAWQMQQQDPLLRFKSEWVLSKRFPRWHFPIANDLERSAVYREALQAQVRPGMVVLEIGAGSGILAMLAAEAGASHVYACEMEPLLADAARRNIARNGLQGKVTVIEKKSTELQLGVDLPGPVDLVLSEIVSNDLLSEGVLPVYEDLVRRLAKPDAVYIPQRIAIRGSLAGGEALLQSIRVDQVHGFDISAMNDYAPPRIIPDHHLVTSERLLSAPTDIYAFDLSSGGPWPEAAREMDFEVIAAGDLVGVLHWIHMDMGAGVIFENAPPNRSRTWSPMLCVMDRRTVSAGDVVRVHAEHDRHSVFLWSGGR